MTPDEKKAQAAHYHLLWDVWKHVNPYDLPPDAPPHRVHPRTDPTGRHRRPCGQGDFLA